MVAVHGGGGGGGFGSDGVCDGIRCCWLWKWWFTCDNSCGYNVAVSDKVSLHTG